MTQKDAAGAAAKGSDPVCTSVDCDPRDQKSIGRDYDPYNDVRLQLSELTGLGAEINTAVQSDPACSSAGCEQYLHPKPLNHHPMDYPVPNFGVDEDIIATQSHIKQANTALGMDDTRQKEGLKEPKEASKKSFDAVAAAEPAEKAAEEAAAAPDAEKKAEEKAEDKKEGEAEAKPAEKSEEKAEEKAEEEKEAKKEEKKEAKKGAEKKEAAEPADLEKKPAAKKAEAAKASEKKADAGAKAAAKKAPAKAAEPAKKAAAKPAEKAAAPAKEEAL